MKLRSRLAGAAFAFYMSVIVAFIMTLALLTAVNGGVGDQFMARVLRGYGIAWPLAFLSVLVIRPLVIKLVSWTVALPR